MATYGKPFTMGWMDPVNVDAQNYISYDFERTAAPG